MAVYVQRLRDDQWPAWLVRFQQWWPTWRYLPLAALTGLVLAVTAQAGCEARRGLWIEEQRAIIDAARRQGKTIVYDDGRDNSIGRVKK